MNPVHDSLNRTVIRGIPEHIDATIATQQEIPLTRGGHHSIDDGTIQREVEERVHEVVGDSALADWVGVDPLPLTR